MSYPVIKIQAALAGIAALTLTSSAMAYIGPGSGLSAIGSLLALFAAVIVAFVGFFWYPLKRMFKGDEDDGIEEDVLESNSQEAGQAEIKEQ